MLDSTQGQEYAEWDPAIIHAFKEGAGATASGIPVKRVYGSDFAYRDVRAHMPVQTRDVTAFASFATGGLSNVWGSAVLPYRAADIEDWPVRAEDLAPYYERVFDFLPLAAEDDDLREHFPLHSTAARPLRPSMQAKRLLDRMRTHRDHLRREGIVFGASRLAVEVAPRGERRGCVYCGLCMYGCPHDVIYKSSQTLRALVSAGGVCYRRDVVVETVREEGERVVIQAHHRVTGQPEVITAARVFVACGVVPTARIMLRSQQLGGQAPSYGSSPTLTMRDSQYFLLPILGLRGERGADRERLHTLAQVFVELFDPALGSHPVHLQVYTYNDLYSDAMRAMFSAAYPLVRLPAGIMLNRLMVIQGYLHSSLSSTATISLDGDAVVLQRNLNPEAGRTVRKVVRKLWRNARGLGFVPLSPLLKIGNPGQGSHVGGTFPMRRHPGPMETDLLGRPSGFTRVHLVDASVLPSIPSTTITLSVMANAYRIGSEWSQHV